MATLYFLVKDQKLVITKNPLSNGKPIHVHLNAESKAVLKDFIASYNMEDILERHIYLSLLFVRFQRLKDDNPELYDFFLRAWTSVFHSLHACLFPPTTKVFTPIKGMYLTDKKPLPAKKEEEANEEEISIRDDDDEDETYVPPIRSIKGIKKVKKLHRSTK